MSVLSKIKKFFISIFNPKKMLDEPIEAKKASKEIETKNSNGTFAKLKEDAHLLELEKKLMKGEISEEQLDKDDVVKLKELLISKRDSLQKELDSYAKKIYNILSKDEKFLDDYKEFEAGNINEDIEDETTIVKFRLYKRALELL